MPRATNTPTTAPAQPRASQAGAPTIIALGRMRADLYKEYVRHDEAQYHSPRTDEGKRAAEESGTAQSLVVMQMDGLDAAIRSMRPATLAEVAVQLSVVADHASMLNASQTPLADLEKALEEVERITLAALPIVASAAGLDIAEMGWNDQVELCSRKFGALGAAQ